MINFKLEPKNFLYLGTEYNIIEITKNNYKNYINLIEKTIQNFNEEIEWNEMFDLETSINRFENDMKMYIGVIDNEPFGHIWAEFTNTVSLNRNLYNLFIKNRVKKKNYTGKEFLSCVIEKYLKEYNLFCEVDDWNIKSIKLFEKLGFKRI